MSDFRGLGRARLFLGSALLAGAVATWATAVLMSPHGGETATSGVDHVRTVIVVFMRNSAIGTLILSALSAWLLFPQRRPKKPVRDWVIAGILALMVLSSLYQLIWLETSVTH